MLFEKPITTRDVKKYVETIKALEVLNLNYTVIREIELGKPYWSITVKK